MREAATPVMQYDSQDVLPSEEAPIQRFTDCRTRFPITVGGLSEVRGNLDRGGVKTFGIPSASTSAYTRPPEFLPVALFSPWPLPMARLCESFTCQIPSFDFVGND